MSACRLSTFSRPFRKLRPDTLEGIRWREHRAAQPAAAKCPRHREARMKATTSRPRPHTQANVRGRSGQVSRRARCLPGLPPNAAVSHAGISSACGTPLATNVVPDGRRACKPTSPAPSKPAPRAFSSRTPDPTFFSKPGPNLPIPGTGASVHRETDDFRGGTYVRVTPDRCRARPRESGRCLRGRNLAALRGGDAVPPHRPVAAGPPWVAAPGQAAVRVGVEAPLADGGRSSQVEFSGDLDAATSVTVVSCSLVVVDLAVTPWRYVWRNYMRAPADRWR